MKKFCDAENYETSLILHRIPYCERLKKRRMAALEKVVSAKNNSAIKLKKIFCESQLTSQYTSFVKQKKCQNQETGRECLYSAYGCVLNEQLQERKSLVT